MEDPESGRKFHKETPLLVIDDESDQASVDTKKVPLDEEGNPDEEHDPTRTNALIRRLLYSFGKSAYVGYTATPFANIFIHEQNETKNEGQDLFPRSFIVNIPPPSNYTGAARIFGIQEDEATQLEEVPSLPITREIDDYALKRNGKGQIDDDGWVHLAETEGWMPPKLVNRTEHIPRYENEEKIPPSLREAMMAFILATTVREIREGLECHNSMLIHVMRYTKVQARVAVQISQELKGICERLDHGDGDRVPTIIDEFRELWESDFVSTLNDPVFASKDFDNDLSLPEWSVVEEQLRSVAASIEVRSINGSAADVLDYDSYTERGLNVIAVGADKLSRGLTLEGLTVSYFLRASKMYDTLMQMGRWFGYRGKYIDVCRLYTTSDLIEWFTHIAAASEELRQEFDYMVNVGGTPRDYGLKVMSHPVLLVTSAVKMRSGTELKLTYSGDISETIIFDTSTRAIQKNWETTQQFLGDLPAVGKARSSEKKYFWRDIGSEKILNFLDDFRSHPDSRRADTRLLASYIRRQFDQGELTDWSVLLVSSSLSSRSWEIPGLGKIGLIKRSQYLPLPEDPSEKSLSRYTIRRLLSPADEWQDLKDEEFNPALELSIKNWKESKRKEKSKTAPTTPGGKETRRFRSKQRGFLILYPLDGNETHVEAKEPVVGMAISFPYSDTAKEISYKVNNVFTDAGDIDSI
ncbi:Z1 domain-containing protein [Verrucomicrobiales bacterium]|nr:Z1 domain-containing protein [Verrucomicrobiales bacterium]